MNATRSLIQNSSTCEKSQFAMVEFMMNSCESEAFSMNLDETVGEEDMWSTNQEESSNLVEK